MAMDDIIINMDKVQMCAMLIGETIHKFIVHNEMNKAELCQALCIIMTATLEEDKNADC